MTKNTQNSTMEYNRLGRAGLKVSELSFGSWVTFGDTIDTGLAKECMQAAADAGVNFFDNAEVYAGGQSETIMGKAIEELGWNRSEYIISTKLFWGISDGKVNLTNTLNRKYLMQGIDGSLERLGLDFVDLIYCHRPDPESTIEETVWAMSDIVSSGKALYWGTSEWSADEIRAAYEIAERHHLHKPYMEQPQYNLLERTKVEQEYARLYDDIGLGLTTWSPLAGGILTGKYLGEIPEGSRAAGRYGKTLEAALGNETQKDQVRKLVAMASDLGVTPAQLSLAWLLKNPNVSTVITGATSVKQLNENLGALEAKAALTDEAKAELDQIFA
ncbi:potassium channel beta subunit family protein [Pseudoglutamicibacter cumminsii]|uniref:potassium channel beta subunit family protein n=1 Tax=Pseudoglutamicibacter cumminsii TaxID=156979 RepID=UPI001EF88D1F|nr:aldo/keto reductase [Pseudoglutamicibacter cumminsii]MBM7795292.1 voltage-dependent potassium channel beta subunit [Pseudoglutamicibacter cumminsii]